MVERLEIIASQYRTQQNEGCRVVVMLIINLMGPRYDEGISMPDFHAARTTGVFAFLAYCSIE